MTGCGDAGTTVSPPAPSLSDIAFVGVDIVDVQSGTIVPDQTVYIEGDRIARLDGASGSPPATHRIVDGSGLYLMPGLSDMHAHVSRAEQLVYYLDAGVTRIRNLWGLQQTLELKQAVERGDVDGPRITTAGRIVDGVPPAFDMMRVITDPADADAFVKAQADLGYDFVKTYTNLTVPVFDALLEAGQRHGMEISGHLPHAVPLESVLDGRMRTMEHFLGVTDALVTDPDAPGLDLYLLRPDVSDYVQRIGRGEIGLADVVDEGRIDVIGEAAAKADVWFVPTSHAMKNFTTFGSGPHSIKPRAHRALPQDMTKGWERSWAFRNEYWPADARRAEDEIYALRMRALKRMHDAGTKMMIGTDAPVPGMYWGYSVIDEMRTLEEAGLSRADVLRSAVIEPAAYLGRSATAGKIAAGAEADLILLGGNPLEDLDALERPLGTMVAGRWYDRSDLDVMIADLTQTYRSREAVMDGAPTLSNSRVMPFVASDGRVGTLSVRDGQEFHVMTGWRQSTAENWQVVTQLISPDAIQTNFDGVSKSRVPFDAPTVVLTGMPSDLVAIADLAASIGSSGEMFLSVVQCRAAETCGTTLTRSAKLVKGEMQTILDRSSFNNALPYRLYFGDDTMPDASFWYSSGGAVGRATGADSEPLRYESALEEFVWERLE
ncbi:MAG: amidohydrolase family protein [Pseudomonadota bacterium]